jgi:hypothetical protein
MNNNRLFLNLLITKKLTDEKFSQLLPEFIPTEDFFENFMKIQSQKVVSKKILTKMANAVTIYVSNNNKFKWIFDHLNNVTNLTNFHMMIIRNLKKFEQAKEFVRFYAV